MQTKINSIQLIKLPENVQSLKSATHSVILNTKDFDSKTQKILISFESKVFEINPLTMDANITIKERANSPLQNNLIPADTYRIKGHIVDPKTLRVSGSVLQEFLNKVENSQYQKADRMLNATDTIMGNYQEILEKWRKEQDDKSQISQIFFADLDVDPKEGNGPKKRVINAKDTAVLNDSLYIVCKTKNMQGKKVKIYVRQGKKDGLEGINQNVQMFMNNSYSTSMEMTVGREASQNIYTNSEQLKDYAYGKIKLIPKEAIEGSTENLKKWKEILDKAQDKQTFLYIYAETLDDPSVFFDDSKNGDFLVIKGEVAQQEQANGIDNKNTCGIQYRKNIICTRYNRVNYGPLYSGNIKIKDFISWDDYISTGKLTKEERDIICGMSVNEGNLDAVQSYDSEILTFGAMQKTINPLGYGELSKQLWDFKNENPNEYKRLIENCGWKVEQSKETGNKPKASYKGMTGDTLKKYIRIGFNAKEFGKNVVCIPMETFINLGKSKEYQSKQIDDFIIRLRGCLEETVVEKYHTDKKKNRIPDKNYSFKVKDIFTTKLGKATVLDQSVNRPSLVRFNIGEALNRFFDKNPSVSKNPDEWGSKRNVYEKQILDDYGLNREGTEMKARFSKLKSSKYLI